MQDRDPTSPAGGPALMEPDGPDSSAGKLASPAARAPMKFAYATGARPLDGYTVKRGVGVGGFGEVYFATTDAGKEVALKRVQRNLDIEIRGVSTCLNLKHPHLVALYDIKYDDQGQAWVVMEYVNGESLKDVIDRNPEGMPLDQVKHWMTGICAGVGYLHDHGIVHRDLKPGNLFLDEGFVKVGDYGLSKFISCSRRSGQTESVGTFHYMAPEIGRGQYGREIDVYALGIVLYEMLSGRVPFDGESSQEIIMKHLTADPDVSSLPRPFGDVIARAMKKDPQQRYRDVHEMIAALSVGGAVPTTPTAVVASNPAPLEILNDAPVPLYIGDEPPEMEFGEMRQKPPVIGGIGRRAVPDAALRRNNPGGQQPHAATAQRPTAQRPKTQRPRATADAGSVGYNGAITYVDHQEPIAAAVGKGFSSLGSWWNDRSMGTPLKVLILLAIGAALVFNASWLVPIAMGAGILYAVYYGIWATVTAWHEPDTIPEPTSPGTQRNHFRRRRWQDSARDLMKRRSPQEKTAELTGSFLMAAFTSIVATIIVMLLGASQFTASADTYAFFAWFAISSTLGSWLVLASGKVLEGRAEEPVRRRFALLIIGLVVGAASFGVQQLLMINLRDSMPFPTVTNSANTAGAYENHLPLLPAYLAYFAGIFVVLRWWKQVDPLRSTRLSIFTTGVCVLWAGVLEMFWHFPQPWGLMLVASISVAAQLAAPWLTHKERAQLREQALRPQT